MVRSARLRRPLAYSLISCAPYSKLLAQFHRMRPAEQQSTLAPILAQVLLVMAAAPLSTRRLGTLLNLIEDGSMGVPTRRMLRTPGAAAD
jgi:hypothetical protein